ncbi:MAG: type II secretion system protein [bacterium]
MRRRGFTIIEILIVLSIIAVLVISATPLLTRFNNQLTLNAAAKTIASELRLLQTKAKTTHSTMTLNLNNLKIPAKIKISGKTEVSFVSSGAPLPGSSGTITLTNRNGQTKKIVIASSGRVRVE